MSAIRIKGAEGVIIDSNYFLELPKAQSKTTTFAQRAGMIRYNSEWKSFEGAIDFEDGTVSYRRFANLDVNGQLLSSQLPGFVTSGMNYIGTYSPLSDDIDPPIVVGQFDKLPEPTAENAGNYFIVRGIYDAATVHYRANTPAESPVTFIPDNPSAAGNWIEIKYYFDTDPVHTNSSIVVSAFARIITSAIPADGHGGLLSLAADPDLTAEYSVSSDRVSEQALTDGDWIISTGTKQQRLRNNRVSISAGAVNFDRTLTVATNRNFLSSAGTVQNTLDNLIQYGLRRTGDAMTDDGTSGGGRLGLTYGTATKPSVAFNSAPYDADTNPGTDPSKWTDTSTGIFHPANGSIGFTSNGIERLRVAPNQITLYTSAAASASSPDIVFSASGNTNLGILAAGNKLSLVSAGVVNAEFAQGQSKIVGSLSVTENIQVQKSGTFGTSSTDTATFKSNVLFSGSTVTSTADVNLSGKLILKGASTANDVVVSRDAVGAGISVKFSTGTDNLTLYEPNGSMRTVFSKDGLKIPEMQVIDNAIGTDGMIAYSTERRTVMQKTNGQWSNVGSGGGGVVMAFTADEWVLDGDYYTYTIPNPDIQTVQVQEQTDDSFSPVDVDTLKISPTNAVLSVPAEPDLRFAGRVIVTYDQ